MKQKQKSMFSLTSGEADAILCALPLVRNLGAENPIQAQINAQACQTAGAKLRAHSGSLTPNEFRVCSLAVDLALEILRGDTDLAFAADVDVVWLRELGQWLFTYNRLQPMLDRNIRPR